MRSSARLRTGSDGSVEERLHSSIDYCPPVEYEQLYRSANTYSELGVRQGPGAKRFDLGVEIGADPGDLGLGDCGVDPECADEVIHGTGGHPCT